MVGCQENGERGCEGKRGGGKKREGERKEEREGTYSHVYGGGGRREGSLRWRKVRRESRRRQKPTEKYHFSGTLTVSACTYRRIYI